MGAAKAKGIPIDDVEVHAEFKRNISPKFHGDYHGDPERRKLAIGVIRTSYYIHGDVSEEQKAELLDELANCPIHNTLITPPKLEERIVVLEKEETAPNEVS